MRTMFGLLKVTVVVAVIASVFAAPGLLFASNSGAAAPSSATPAPIVGFWYIKLAAKGNVGGPPDGAVIDWGLQQWQSDGTEILNSGSGPKRFCLGVWAKGPGSTYVLNHFPLDYPDATTLHIIRLREKVTVSRNRASMTGTFTFDIYDAAGKPLQHIAGDVTGHRITVGSSVQDVLPPTP